MGRRFEGKIAVVAGGGSGIGRATAILLSSEGATVMVADRAAQSAAETIHVLSGPAASMACDISSEPEVCRLAAKVDAEYGRLDVFVSSVAVFVMKSCLEAHADDWQSVLSTNVTGAALCARHLAPLIQRSGGGSIVLVNSISGKKAEAGYATYSTSKAALLMLARSMAIDLAPWNIRVNTVTPGPVDTPALRRELARGGTAWEEFEQTIAKTQCVPRVVQAEDVARAIAFLAGAEASMITGADLAVDGGFGLLV